MRRRGMRGVSGFAARPPGPGPVRPLALIHTNNSPSPAGMRVPEGLDPHDRGLLLVWLDGYSRGVADAKSTRR